MADERLPIKFFAPREVDEWRNEGSGSSDIPKWVLDGNELIQHSEKLFSTFSQFAEILADRKSRKSAVPFVFVAKICDDSTAKSRRKDISSLFQTDDDSNIIGLVDTDELIVKLKSISQMDTISARLKDYARHSYALSCLDTFWEFQPLIQEEEGASKYKIKLINFQDYEMNVSLQRLFERALTSRKILFNKTIYANQYPVYKVEIPPQVLLDKLQDDNAREVLFSIEPMPKYVVSLDSVSEEVTIGIKTPVNGHRYETLGILDSGIHPVPHLDHWITDKRWSVYPDSDIDPSHGTFVAGVALYGDVCEGQDWVGHRGIKLLDATIFPDQTKEEIDEDELIANISEAIKANHHKVKIWNLSVSVLRPVSDYKFSDFAIALDSLQDKYNILICKSAGNCTNFVNGLPKERILEGADSVRSLVVGSVAHVKGVDDFAEIGNPSPFSRIGPGPEFIIKPEVSHYGGNAGVQQNGNLVTTGIKSFSIHGGIATSVGTSFSTPRIASLATGLFQELNEDFDPLLLKGLIVHSASYSENLKVPVTERTKQLGFGVPGSVSQILYNAPYEATLILRDTLSKGESINIMDFPMPQSLIKENFYTGQIIATLVYDPILDPTQGLEYCQSNIDVKFGSYDEKKERDINKRNILNPIGREGAQNLFIESLYSKRLMRGNESDFALRERLLIQYADKYYPVKKYAVDLSELSEANKQRFLTPNKQWYLFLGGLFREHTEHRARLEQTIPSQEFCLIITIRDPKHMANVYDEVTQGLDLFNFWHSNIKLSSDISIPI